MIRLGRWQDVLADVECDAVICDPPYDARTHDGAAGHRRFDGVETGGSAPAYEPWDVAKVREFFESWSPRCRGWICLLTDHNLISTVQEEANRVGRCTFPPVVCVLNGMTVRLAGDGPSSWALYLMVTRPRSKSFATWGTTPGAYVGARGSEAGGGRGKPDWLMRAIIRDYTRPNELVVDPFAGWGSTISAALGMGRNALGAEMDADAHAEAMRRLGRGQQRDLFAAIGGAA